MHDAPWLPACMNAFEFCLLLFCLFCCCLACPIPCRTVHTMRAALRGVWQTFYVACMRPHLHCLQHAPAHAQCAQHECRTAEFMAFHLCGMYARRTLVACSMPRQWRLAKGNAAVADALRGMQCRRTLVACSMPQCTRPPSSGVLLPLMSVMTSLTFFVPLMAASDAHITPSRSFSVKTGGTCRGL